MHEEDEEHRNICGELSAKNAALAPEVGADEGQKRHTEQRQAETLTGEEGRFSTHAETASADLRKKSGRRRGKINPPEPCDAGRLLEDCRVTSGVEQGSDVLRVAELYPNHPRGAVGVLIDGFGGVHHRIVHLYDFASERHIEIAGSLYGFYHAESLAFIEGLTDGGELDEGDIAKGFLSVISDADGCGAILIDAQPFVIGSVFKVGGNLAHD